MTEARVRAVILTANNLSGPQMCEVFLRHMPRIQQLALATPPPCILLVSRASVVLASR